MEHYSVPRFVFTDFPLGNPAARRTARDVQRAVVELALGLLSGAEKPRTTVAAPFDWHDPEWRGRYGRVDPAERERLRRSAINAARQVADENHAMACSCCRPTTLGAPLFFMAPGAPTPVAPSTTPSRSTAGASSPARCRRWPDDDSKPLPPDIEGQTVRVMEDLKIVLGGLKLGLEHVICARVYITDFETNYPRMNEVYASYFPADRRPARTCIGVTGLARGAMVEIDLLAKR